MQTEIKSLSVSELHGLGVQILFDHQSHFEYDRIVELTQIESGEFFDLFQSVNQRIAVHEKLAGGFGYVQIVLEETLNRKQRFLIKTFDGIAFEYLAQEHIAQSRRELIDQPCDAEIVIADDDLFRIEHFADFKCDLRFLERVRPALP